MQNEKEFVKAEKEDWGQFADPIEGRLDNTDMDPGPPVASKAGLRTSEGQFTAIFTVVALILSVLGFSYSPEQIEGWVELVETFLKTLGPVLAVIPVLMTYINSRGKIKSNTITSAAVSGLSQPTMTTMATMGDFGGLLSGKSWKDPKRYIDLARVAGSLGVPGVAKGLDILDTASGTDDGFKQDVAEAIHKLSDRITALERK